MKCKYFIFTVTFCFRDSLDAGDQNDSPPSSELDTAGAEPERAHEEVAEAGPSSQPQKKKGKGWMALRSKLCSKSSRKAAEKETHGSVPK